MELKELVGKHLFQGIEVGEKEIYVSWMNRTHVSYVKFTMDGITYIAMEDPSDGYRSYCRELDITTIPCKTLLPNIEIICKHRSEGVGYYSSCDILEVIDAQNGETILLVGTNNTDDYYPFCLFEYTPENMSCNE